MQPIQSVKDMEVDELVHLNKNMDQTETPNTNNSIPSESKNNHNSMEIDTDHTNKEKNATSIQSHPFTTDNAPKRRKKRKRDEMEIDINNTTKHETNHKNHNNSSNLIKRRKVTKPTTNKTPKKSLKIQPMPQNWQDKYKQYKNIITSNYKLLSNETTSNKLFCECSELQTEIETFKSKTSNSTNINFNDYTALICALSYGRNDTLTDLLISIKNTLNISSESAINIREIILKSMHRKLYGIKPISKSIHKNEEKTAANSNEPWHKCRVYEWECLNMDNIASEYQMDNKKKKTFSLIMTKYGSFCKKYDILCRNATLKMDEKSRELQKIDDVIIAWQGKEEALRRKKELKEKELAAKKEKREEMEKLRREKAEKKKKDKAEMEILRREKAEKKKKEKAEKLHLKEKQRKEKLEKERLEKEKENNSNKTPNLDRNKQKKRKSFIDNWVKTSAKKKSLSDSLSPLSKYKKLFIPPKYSSNTIIAPMFCNQLKENGNNLIELRTNGITINQKNKNRIAATSIPAVFVDRNVEIDNMVSRMQIDTENENNMVLDVENKIKLQWKYREFFEDNRPCFFGVNKKNLAQSKVNIARLRRSPFARTVRPRESYSDDDSGIEWYDDIDDLEKCSDYDEDEEAQVLEIENYEKNGMIREDGFENDKFILNESDEDDCDVLNDKDIMKTIKKTKLLQSALKDEYPIKFLERKRGDAFDRPIVINLLSFDKERKVLYELRLKKTFVFDEDEIGNGVHAENENDIAHLLQIENKDNEREENERNEEKKKKKKKKKEKEKKKKEKQKKNESMKMECDDDEDDDIKMVNVCNENSDKPKISTQNTLNHYFMKATKNGIKKNKNNNTADVEQKKKRRVVMCELVE